MLRPGTHEMSTLGANGTAVAFNAMFGYGIGVGTGPTGVTHTSGNPMFIPAPLFEAGSMAVSYPRWIWSPLMLIVSSVTIEAFLAVRNEASSTTVCVLPAWMFSDSRTRW